MAAWATLAQARTHWPDAVSIPDATLTVLLDAATTVCREYAPNLRRVLTDGATTSTSPTVTSATGSFDESLDVSAAVTGTGIPAATTVLGVVDGSTITLSANATVTGTSVTLTLVRQVPNVYVLATVYQAREIFNASSRDTGDVVGFGEYALRARPMTAAVKSLLRPKRGLGVPR